MAGKIWIVGAGPGSADLLTLRAVAVLRAAEVVLHDDLVSAEVLALCPPSALIINVGKRCGQQRHSQDDINSLMIFHARQDHVVARLKSGDPAIFGRLGEELEALRAAAIDFEIVPGVTAVAAAAAGAGLTLTDRRTASSLVFLTGHSAGDQSLRHPAFDLGKSSYAVYMPGPDYEHTAAGLMEMGIAPATPCALVSQAGRSSQQIHFMRVASLKQASGISAPAILIVGRVAGHAASAEHARRQITTELPPDLAAAASGTIDLPADLP
jgi:uroporphyrin-III C-methyltransferase